MGRRARQASWPVIALVVVALLLWLNEQRRRFDTPAEGGGRYQRFDGCTWVDHRQNDGDSFRVRLPDGRVEQFRLYFVDAPESAFRSYGGGRSNRQRVEEQARYFGLTPERAVAVGVAAKEYVHELLAGEAFTLQTEWDDPFADRRYHAFVRAPGPGPTWLHERLVERGLARIHTKGAVLPGGVLEAQQRARLAEIERSARSRGQGGWSRVEN